MNICCLSHVLRNKACDISTRAIPCLRILTFFYLEKLKREHKKEFKGALRELRKDTKFITKQRLEDQLSRDSQRYTFARGFATSHYDMPFFQPAFLTNESIVSPGIPRSSSCTPVSHSSRAKSTPTSAPRPRSAERHYVAVVSLWMLEFDWPKFTWQLHRNENPFSNTRPLAADTPHLPQTTAARSVPTCLILALPLTCGSRCRFLLVQVEQRNAYLWLSQAQSDGLDFVLLHHPHSDAKP